MFTINIPKVRGKMAERGYSITTLAKELEINRNTLSSYLESPGKIPFVTISRMADILFDSKEEASSIFFSEDLRKT